MACAFLEYDAGWVIFAMEGLSPERLVSEVYNAFRSFVESASYKAEEWEWNGVDEGDLPDLDTDAFKFFEARLPVWDGFSLCGLRSAWIEDNFAG